jgi:hypothetical protein
VNQGGKGGDVVLQASARGTASGGAMNTDGANGNVLAKLQNATDSRFGVQAAGSDLFAVNSQYSNSTVHIVSSGSAPGISGCTGATIAATATDQAGKVTSGATGACAATLTFSTAWPFAPACWANNETTATPVRATSTTTTLVLDGVTVTGDVLSYVCVGNV